MGLTWIDHDTIEKPVEELAMGTAEAQGIEFTIETLGTTPDEKGGFTNAPMGGPPYRRESAMCKGKVHILIIFVLHTIVSMCTVQ